MNEKIGKGIKKLLVLILTGCIMLSSVSATSVVSYATEYVMPITETEVTYYDVIETSVPVILEDLVFDFSCEEEQGPVLSTFDEEEQAPAESTFEEKHQCNIVTCVDVAPTHTTTGTEVEKCTTCGAIFATRAIPMTQGHTSSDWITERNATCNSEGYSYRKCVECGEILESRTTAVTSHSYKETIEVEATYTSKGVRRHNCINCGYTYLSAIPVKVCSDHSWVDVSVIKEPTYKTTGTKKIRCAKCNIEDFIVIEKLNVKDDPNHVHEFVDDKIVKEATCKAYGKKNMVCTTCGEIISEAIELNAENHESLLEITEVDPDNPKKSIIHKTCTACGYSEDEEICKEGQACRHSLTSQKKIVNQETGKSEIWFFCQVCDELLSKVETYVDCLHRGLGVYNEVQCEGSETEERVVLSRCRNCDEILNTLTYPPYKAQEIEMADGQTETVYGYYDEDLSRQVFDLLNEYRVANGLNALNWADNISQYADLRAAEASVVFDHTRPNGDAWYNLDKSHMNGENLAMGYQSPESVMTAWKYSPGHNENMLFDRFKSVAISCFVKYTISSNGTVNKTYFYSQNFSVYR